MPKPKEDILPTIIPPNVPRFLPPKDFRSQIASPQALLQNYQDHWKNVKKR
jgi:hypothetical protein